MDRERILAILRQHEPELKAAGLLHLRLFGSVARGDNTAVSDVDLMADFDITTPLTLLKLARIEYQLDDLLGVKVDISSADWMYPLFGLVLSRRQSLPFRASALPLQHILDSIAHIEGFLTDMDFATYQADLKTKSAVERQMQIVTEAAFRLGEDAQTFCPEIDWRAIRGMGNRLRHWYDKISDRIIWDAVQIDLPPLKIAVAAALKQESHVDPA